VPDVSEILGEIIELESETLEVCNQDRNDKVLRTCAWGMRVHLPVLSAKVDAEVVTHSGAFNCEINYAGAGAEAK